eukprot:7060640-Prymnesium_polylepis.2
MPSAMPAARRSCNASSSTILFGVRSSIVRRLPCDARSRISPIDCSSSITAPSSRTTCGCDSRRSITISRRALRSSSVRS